MQLALAYPILPGKREAVKALAKTVSGPKSKEFHDMEKRYKTDKETWFLQPSPQGDMVIYYSEGKDLSKSFSDWAASKNLFDVWFKQELKELTGIDFNNPPEGPLPEQIFKYRF